MVFQKVTEKSLCSGNGQRVWEQTRPSCEKDSDTGFPSLPSPLPRASFRRAQLVLCSHTAVGSERPSPIREGPSLTPTGWLTSLGESVGLEDKVKRALMRKNVLEGNYTQQAYRQRLRLATSQATP